jgi:hypothetical protein
LIILSVITLKADQRVRSERRTEGNINRISAPRH